MRGVAIETSGRTGSVALVEDVAVISEGHFAHGLQHAAGLVPLIDRLYQQANWTPRDAREIYVSAGPGSFTGVRIGITLAKTLAFATDAKIVAVPSTQVLAHNAPPQAVNIIVVLDAKRGQIFTARFEQTVGGLEPREPAHLDTLSAMLERSPRPVHLIGEGIPYHAAAIAEAGEGVIVTPEETWRARAEIVARLGTELARQGNFTSADKLIPTYIRRPEAEEKFEAAHPNPA